MTIHPDKLNFLVRVNEARQKEALREEERKRKKKAEEEKEKLDEHKKKTP